MYINLINNYFIAIGDIANYNLSKNSSENRDSRYNFHVEDQS